MCMNMFVWKKTANSTKKNLNWKYIFYKLHKNQYFLSVSNYQPRKIRNIQRLIVTSFFVKLIIISQYIQNFYTIVYSSSTNQYIKQFKRFEHYKPLYLNNIVEYKKLIFNIKLLRKKTYYDEFKLKMQQIGWILACLPIHQTLANHVLWDCKLYKNSQDFVYYFKRLLHLNSIEWVNFLKFGFCLTKNIKIWLIRYFFIEKTFLILWFLRTQNPHSNIDQIWLLTNACISFKRLLKLFYLRFFIQLLKYYISGERTNKTHISNTRVIYIYYNGLFICGSESFSYNYKMKQIKMHMHNYNAYTIPRLKCYSLYKGFTLFGWYFMKQNTKILQNISSKTIRSHQLELKRFLNTSGNLTMDQIIYRLNQKITCWQNYYLSFQSNRWLYKKLNNYLFWRIWYFLKKRHKTKGVKWICKHYSIKKSYKKWLFESNNSRLFSYNIPLYKPSSKPVNQLRDYNRAV